MMLPEDRHEALEAFWSAVKDHFFQEGCGDLEYMDFLELGEKHGLLKTVPYDPETHGDTLVGDPEPGDPIYFDINAA
jgi:hypothetical protein